jgi:hypothetical protein
MLEIRYEAGANAVVVYGRQRPQRPPSDMMIVVEYCTVDQRIHRRWIAEIPQQIDDFPAHGEVRVVEPVDQIRNDGGTKLEKRLSRFPPLF